jgi:hypothetical protein
MCALLSLVYVSVLIGLTFWAAILTLLCFVFGSGSAACREREKKRCRIKQIQFRLKHCGTGNSDPCLGL